MDTKQRYQCPECGWVGIESEMKSDWSWAASEDSTDEVWSNSICPKCNTWRLLEDYKKVDNG